MTEDEARRVMMLAIGRIFRLGSRPEQPGDVEEYEKARRAALDAADVLGIGPGYTGPGHAASVLTRHRATYGDT